LFWTVKANDWKEKGERSAVLDEGLLLEAGAVGATVHHQKNKWGRKSKKTRDQEKRESTACSQNSPQSPPGKGKKYRSIRDTTKTSHREKKESADVPSGRSRRDGKGSLERDGGVPEQDQRKEEKGGGALCSEGRACLSSQHRLHGIARKRRLGRGEKLEKQRKKGKHPLIGPKKERALVKRTALPGLRRHIKRDNTTRGGENRKRKWKSLTPWKRGRSTDPLSFGKKADVSRRCKRKGKSSKETPFFPSDSRCQRECPEKGILRGLKKKRPSYL